MDARLSLFLLWHVGQALGVQVLDEGFHSLTEGVEWMLAAVVFQEPQHATNIGGTSHIHRLFRQFIHSSEIARQPVSVGEIEPIALSLEKGLTRFRPKAERHIIALSITPSHRHRHQHEHKEGNQKVSPGASHCLTHTTSPLCFTSAPWGSI